MERAAERATAAAEAAARERSERRLLLGVVAVATMAVAWVAVRPLVGLSVLV